MHTSFLSRVCIRPYKSYKYHLCEEVVIRVGIHQYKIHKGFITDLASIPRPFWCILSPAHSALIRASIVHDWFYKGKTPLSRKQIDKVFFHMLRNDGISWIRAKLMYSAVRLFGGKFYKGRRQ